MKKGEKNVEKNEGVLEYCDMQNNQPLLSRYEAILFDLDGTLIDTVQYYSDACIGAFCDFGFPATHSDFQRFYSTGTLLEPLMKFLGVDPLMIDDLRARRDERYMEILKTSATLLPSADTLLKSLSKKQVGIVTMAYRKYVDQFYHRLGLSDHIDVLITCDDVAGREKPDPHGLFLAANKLGVDPTKCIYIGDQPFDIEAAKRACMKSCLIRTAHTPTSAYGKADYEVDSIVEVQNILCT